MIVALAAEPRELMVLSTGKLFRAATRTWYGPFARPDRIVNVAVHDPDFQLVRVLDSERDLVAFRAMWAALLAGGYAQFTPPARRTH